MAFLTVSKAYTYLCDGGHLKTLLPLSNSCKVTVMALSLVMDGHFKIHISHWLLRNISHLSALELNFLQCWDPLDILVKLLGVRQILSLPFGFSFFFKLWHTKLLTQAVGSPSLSWQLYFAIPCWLDPAWYHHVGPVVHVTGCGQLEVTDLSTVIWYWP